jgi:molybdopterin-containing oxidoreductase family membrane subunit
LGIALVFTIWRLVTVSFARVPDASYVTGSPYGLQFWIFYLTIGLIIPFMVLLKSSTRERTKKKESLLAGAGLMVLIGMYVDKHIFVISGQFNQPFNIPIGVYTSTFIEWSLFFGAIAAAIILYLFGEKKLKLETPGKS